MLDKYPGFTPYCYAFNIPITAIDINGNDAIFIHFINYRIGVSGRNIPFIGHAGVLLIDNKTGESKYYDFGRYGDNAKGLVRSNTNLNFQLDNIPINSKGELDKDAISDRLKTVSEKVAKGSEIMGAYIESNKYNEMVDYSDKKFQETNDPNSENTYNEISHNCATFASDVIRQDQDVNGAPTPFLFMPIHFTAWYQTYYPPVSYDNNKNKYIIGYGAEDAKQDK